MVYRRGIITEYINQTRFVPISSNIIIHSPIQLNNKIL